MHMDPALPQIVATLLVVVTVGLALRRLKQPQIVAYLLAGVALGPDGLGLWPDREPLQRLGEFGVLLLLFFAGMEIHVPKLLAAWRVPIIGTAIQISLSVAAAFGVGLALEWPFARSLMLGFVISLSSTAVVLNMLRSSGELDSPLGTDVVGILLAQDIAIIPMLILLALAGGTAVEPSTIALQLGGGVLLISLVVAVVRHGAGPLGRILDGMRGDPEIEFFAAAALCLGLALVSSLFHLSSALGAFIGGIVVTAAAQTEWVHKHLEPLRVLLLAVFFLSIGALVDLEILRAQIVPISVLALAAMLSNTVINAIMLRMLGRRWKRAMLGGAMLSQIGEFSFVLATVGLSAGIIGDLGYQMTVATIAMTLLFSSVWIAAVRGLLGDPNS